MVLGKLGKRTVVLLVGGIAMVALSAAFASDLIPQGSQVEAVTAPLSDTSTLMVLVSDTATLTLATETVTVAETIGSSKVAIIDTVTATKNDNKGLAVETATIPVLIDPQPRIILKIPPTIKVDPRANSYQTSAINFSGSPILLACLSGNGVSFDVGGINTLDNLSSENFIVEGDRTPFLKISGTSGAIAALLRANEGLRIFATNGAITGRSFTISMIALNSPSTKSEYCGASRAVSTSIFSALKIDLDIVKGQGSLKR